MAGDRPPPLGPQAEEPDLDYGEQETDPNADTALIGHRYERTEHVPLGAPWDMAAWVAADRARREAEGAFDAGGHTELVAPWWSVPIPDLPKGKGSARIVAERASAAGFEVRCQASIVYVTPTLFASATEGENPHAKGDLRFSDHDDTWWGVQARLVRQGRLVAAFWAEWCTKEAPGKRAATTFKDALTHDIVLGRMLQKKAGDFATWFDVFAPSPAAK